jgi:hypothetical protein
MEQAILLALPDTIEEAVRDKRFPQCTVDKAWDAIHFILERLAHAGEIPRGVVAPLISGRRTTAGFGYDDVSYYLPSDVQQIAAALTGLSRDQFRGAYDPEAMDEAGVYPGQWAQAGKAESNFEYIWGWFAGLVEFYRDAAAAGEGVFLYIL